MKQGAFQEINEKNIGFLETKNNSNSMFLISIF